MSVAFRQVMFTVNKTDAEAVTDFLTDLGALSISIESADQEQIFDTAEPGEPKWVQQRLSALYPANSWDASLVEQITSRWRVTDVCESTVADQNWERAWFDQFSPIRVSASLWICPSWIDPPDSSATNIVLDPGLAFGTGTHETTLLCLEQLAAMDLFQVDVVDYGCGSGILAIAALKLGARRAIAVDIDPRALQATEDNAQKNRVADKLHCMTPEAFAAEYANQQTDLMIANILSEVLLQLRQQLVSWTNPQRGQLILSGILKQQSLNVLDAFSANFNLTQRVKGDWVMLSGARVS